MMKKIKFLRYRKENVQCMEKDCWVPFCEPKGITKGVISRKVEILGLWEHFGLVTC